MSIQSEINRIRNEANTQTGLIAQIAAALEGKAAGGGSSGGSAVETCTVASDEMGVEGSVSYSDGTQVVMNDVHSLYEPGGTITVAKNSLLYIDTEGTVGFGLTVTGGASFIYNSKSYSVLAVTGDCVISQ